MALPQVRGYTLTANELNALTDMVPFLYCAQVLQFLGIIWFVYDMYDMLNLNYFAKYSTVRKQVSKPSRYSENLLQIGAVWIGAVLREAT